MKKVWIGIIAVALVGFGVWKFTFEPAEMAGEKPVIKIGVSLPLSGDVGNMGNISKGAMEVVLKDIEQKNTKYKYELIFEDNRWDNARAATIANKFINLDKVDAIVTLGSGVGNVTSPLADKAKIIHFSFGASDENVAKGQRNFMNWTMPPPQVEKMINVIQDKGYRNVKLAIGNHAGPISLGTPLSEKLSEAGIKNHTEKLNIGMRDARLEIQKMQADNPDLYVIILFDPELSIFIKQLREAGYKGDITTIEAFSFLDNQEIADGMWYIDASEGDGPVMERIKQHNKSDNILGVSNAYDNIMILVQAFEAAPSKEQAIDEMLKIKEYQGVTGLLKQDEDGIFQSEAVVKQVIDGKAVVLR